MNMRIVTVAGRTWRQEEGSTSFWRSGEWTLFYTDGPSWWLTGDGREEDMCTRGFRVAMRRAADTIDATEDQR